MTFEWNEAKNQANVRKRGFKFAEVEQMFRRPLFVRPDTREDYGEERWVGLGTIGDRIAVVAFTELSQDSIRLISLRKANHEEQKEYEDFIQDGLEAN